MSLWKLNILTKGFEVFKVRVTLKMSIFVWLLSFSQWTYVDNASSGNSQTTGSFNFILLG